MTVVNCAATTGIDNVKEVEARMGVATGDPLDTPSSFKNVSVDERAESG